MRCGAETKLRTVVRVVAVGVSLAVVTGCSHGGGQAHDGGVSASAVVSSGVSTVPSSESDSDGDRGAQQDGRGFTPEQQKILEQAKKDAAEALRSAPAGAPVVGHAASQSEGAEITAVENKLASAATGEQLKDAAASVLCPDDAGDPAVINGLAAAAALSVTGGLNNPAERPVPDVKDITVADDGATASARVTIPLAGTPVTVTRHYRHVDGQWKICRP